MKKNLLFVAFLCFCISGIQAQDKFFWNLADEKVPIIDEQRSLCVFFKAPLRGENLKYRKHPELRNMRGNTVREKTRFIFEFEKNMTQSPHEMLNSLGIDPSLVRSVHWGKSLESGMQLWLTHQVLYELKAGSSLADIQPIWAEYSGASAQETRLGSPFIEINDIEATVSLANHLYESGHVKWAQPNFAAVVMAQGIDTGTPVIPTDSLWHKQLNFNNTGQHPMGDQVPVFWDAGLADWDINMPEAWCETLGDPSIKVAVIDAGVEPHPDLNDDNGGGGSRITAGYAPNPGFVPGGVPQPGAPMDFNAHGQAVAGIIGASHNAIGTAGICPECQILAVCAYADVNNINMSDPTEIGYMADGITWAYQNGADVINNSWAFNTCTGSALFASVETAINNAITLGRGGKGSLVVFSTGQEIGAGFPYNCVGYPATLTTVIAAGAIDYRGEFPGYANYGSELDIVAVTSRQPGANPAGHQSGITAMDRAGGTLGYNRDANKVADKNYTNTDYTRYFGGTSVAAAEVSGVAALVLSKNPNLTVTEVTNLLLANTRTTGIGGLPEQSGNGLLRADLVLAATPAPGLPVEYLSFTGEAKRQKIELNWETAIEINNDFFLVEKEVDGVFRPIGRVEGFGNSSNVQGYTFTDLAPNLGSNFYRLRQVDIDGTLDYSHVLEVVMDASNLGMVTRMFPMPAKGELNVEIFDMERESLQLSILDFRGRSLIRKTVEISQELEILSLDVSSLSAGSYILRINASGDIQEVRKFVITE